MQQPQDFSLYGAVDLGARQAAAQRAQQAPRSGGPGAHADGSVIDVTDATFQTEVLQRSFTVPVIMDLWAEWCGPCKQLGPVLEKLAAEANGEWVLAKVDVDANPQLSQALQVQSIPMVVAVAGGEVVHGFLGALPEAQVRQWLGQVRQRAAQMPQRQGQADAEDAAAAEAPAAGEAPGESVYADAQRAMEQGDFDAAAAAFKRVLADSPADPTATLGLARVELVQRVNSYDESRARREAAERPDDAGAQCRVADLDMAAGRADDAFDRLLGVIRRTSGDERNQARVHLLSLFEAMPPRDSAVARARATLSSLLF